MEVREKKPGRDPHKTPLYVYTIIAVAVLLLLNMIVVPYLEALRTKETDYTSFLHDVQKGVVTEVQIGDEYIHYVTEPSGKNQMYRTIRVEDPDLVSRLLEQNVKITGTVMNNTSMILSLLL
ncbi:MAG: ATP-dependent metallopeptidase FtsH/Yme1/Tma family protein, partial [Clostridiales bacterium]|nr:ATP-dependent metallopeptidase FtsH/Yme1/Tma family protein [Candidatus Blautia equi]